MFLSLDPKRAASRGTESGRKKLYDKVLPQEETKIRDAMAMLAADGKVLIIFDQPATIGALPDVIAQDAGADLQAKTDAQDAQDASIIIGVFAKGFINLNPRVAGGAVFDRYNRAW